MNSPGTNGRGTVFVELGSIGRVTGRRPKFPVLLMALACALFLGGSLSERSLAKEQPAIPVDHADRARSPRRSRPTPFWARSGCKVDSRYGPVRVITSCPYPGARITPTTTRRRTTPMTMTMAGRMSTESASRHDQSRLSCLWWVASERFRTAIRTCPV